MREKEREKEVFVKERYENLEGLDERREKAQERSCRYRQRMTESLWQNVFMEEQLVLRVANYVK